MACAGSVPSCSTSRTIHGHIFVSENMEEARGKTCSLMFVNIEEAREKKETTSAIDVAAPEICTARTH